MSNRRTYLAIGDSITWTIPDNPIGTHHYTAGDVSLYMLQLWQWIQQNYGNCKAINKGLGGTTSKDWTSIAVLRWGLSVVPDLVTIGLGMNDAKAKDSTNPTVTVSQYATNIQTIVWELRRRNPNVSIILCAPPSTTDPSHNLAGSPISAYRTQLQSTASSLNTIQSPVGYCDFSQAYMDNGTWTGTAPSTTYTNGSSTYTCDGIHPTETSHGLIFNVLQPVVQSTASAWLNSLKTS